MIIACVSETCERSQDCYTHVYNIPPDMLEAYGQTYRYYDQQGRVECHEFRSEPWIR